MKRWDTIRLGMYGAFVGVAYEGFGTARYWFIGSEGIAYAVGSLIGAAAGGFVLVAAVSGLRNLIVRAK